MTTPQPPSDDQIGPAGVPRDRRPGRSALKTALVAGTGLAVVGTAGAAFALGHYFGGGGAQPEDVLPRNAVAVFKVDLDPSLGQKKAIYDLSKAFPKIAATTKGSGSVSDDLLSSAVHRGRSGVDYDRDIKPWLGKRAAFAAVPDNSQDGTSTVAAIQYTDKARAMATLDQQRARDARHPFSFAFSGDYVILAETQAKADEYAKATSHLADNPAYKKAVGALDGDQVAVGWADVRGIYAALPKDRLQGNPLFSSLRAPSGSVVIGVHADSHFVEVQGKAVDVADSLTSVGGSTIGAQKGGNLLASFPDDTAAALEVTGLGEALTKAYTSFSKDNGETLSSITDQARALGLQLPDDVSTVLGNDLALGAIGDRRGGSLSVAAHIATSNPAKALEILDKVNGRAGGGPLRLTYERDGGGGYVVGNSRAAVDAVTRGNLGAAERFRRAVPDAKDAGFAMYVDIQRVAQIAGRTDDEDIKHLDAFGLTANGSDAGFRIRLTVR